jgi:squalene-hopene/tetraprenyl-beta-curcumene cyclase
MSPGTPPSAANARERLLDDALAARVDRARDTAVRALLQERNRQGWWTGELSASALSTATAVVALSLVGRAQAAEAERLRGMVQRGYAWLVRNQNPDGGWGDTVRSHSNISTTTLGWAAFGLARDLEPEAAQAVAAAERWLERAAGSLQPAQLVRAIEQRYGADRTFSIPILTMAALCGRLGAGREGWRQVRQLPFEIAALPQRWFGALKLPVVSYALPALIAMGQVRHALRPTRNPLLRKLRNGCRARTLAKLVTLQPENGGFLEATPLTSFVTMSLAAAGLAGHVVVRRGVGFIEASVRDDGSWPIDTNLATWLTTLSVNALAGEPETAGPSAGRPKTDPRTVEVENREIGHRASGIGRFCRSPDRTFQMPDDRCPISGFPAPALNLPELDPAAIREWLVGQQYRIEHPYTLAAPGGWAWTDLPGGVPDADDTAGALLALRALVAAEATAPAADLHSGAEAAVPTGSMAVRDAAEAGVRWLLDLQNRDGGIPTFCRGWGRLPFDRSSPDLTAHAVRAWIAWRAHLSASLQRRVDTGVRRAVDFLGRTQRADGAWIPLWFGHQEHPRDENPLYGTARVIPALWAAGRGGVVVAAGPLERAVTWLVAAQNGDGGWSGAPRAASSVEETGVALEALVSALGRANADPAVQEGVGAAIQRGAHWLAAAVEEQRWRQAAPIGFYFAKLWYFERLYPLIFATGALTRVAALRAR